MTTYLKKKFSPSPIPKTTNLLLVLQDANIVAFHNGWLLTHIIIIKIYIRFHGYHLPIVIIITNSEMNAATYMMSNKIANHVKCS